VKDAEWIADLVCHGLLRQSFVPPKPIRELRDLTRYRRKLVESQSAERNRLLKVLETANIKLASVATDVFGTSGRLMLRALIEGKTTPEEMAELAKRKLRSKIPQLELALEGKIEDHHRFLLKLQWDRLERAEGDLAVLEEHIQEKLEPYAAQLALLDEIPGVDWTLAAVIIAELGVDMSVFQSVSQLASWAGVCPGNNESAGKRKSSRIPKGNVYLKTALVEAAHAAARTKGTYLRDKFHRLKARRGYKRAAVAGKGITFGRTQKWEGRVAVSVTDPRRSNRLPRRRDANFSGMRLWIGCTSGHGRGLLIDGSERRKSAEADADVWHHYARAGVPARMVARGRLHPSGDGEHGRLLETGLELRFTLHLLVD